MSEKQYRFGEKLRAVREKKGLTLKAVADIAGVSESLVSQIERNRISPAIDTLLAILEALQLDIEYVFSDLKREREVLITRRSQRARLSSGGSRWELLSRTPEYQQDAEHGIEAWLLELEVGAEQGNAEYGHKGRELGILEQGRAEFSLGQETWILEEGDSVSFSSSVPHRIKNIGDGPLKAFWIVTPPKGIKL